MFIYYLHQAWRRCRAQWVTTALIVLTLAIGIAACMTAMTIASAFEGEPIPGVSPHLYVIALDAREIDNRKAPDHAPPNSLLKLRDAKALVDAHRAPAQAALTDANLRVGRPDGQSWSNANGLLAYGQVLRVLGIPLRFGRSWTIQELHSHAPVVIVDTHLARHVFGTMNVVGRNVRIGERLFRVIGVTAPWKPRMQFSRVEQAGGLIGSPVRVFLPTGAALDAGVGPAVSGRCGNSAANTMYGSVDVKRCRWLETWVALKTPAAVARYGTFLDGYARAQHDTGRFVHPPDARLYGTRAWMAINDIVVPDDVRLDAYLAGAFLLLCMTNVIGLLTARFLQGRTDAAVRRALGASRRQLFTQNLVESALLGASGGLLALPLTLLGMWIVRQQPVGYVAAAHFSPGVFVSLLLLSLFVGTVVGLWPAWRISCQPPALHIKQA